MTCTKKWSSFKCRVNFICGSVRILGNYSQKREISTFLIHLLENLFSEEFESCVGNLRCFSDVPRVIRVVTINMELVTKITT